MRFGKRQLEAAAKAHHESDCVKKFLLGELVWVETADGEFYHAWETLPEMTREEKRKKMRAALRAIKSK